MSLKTTVSPMDGRSAQWPAICGRLSDKCPAVEGCVVERSAHGYKRGCGPLGVDILIAVLVLSLGGLVAPVYGDVGSIPKTASELTAWLEKGDYQNWTGKSVMRPSAGPHFGQVKVFVSPALSNSLHEGRRYHPTGAAAVKELYGNGQTLRGWAVSVKLAGAAVVGGSGRWYWFEVFDGQLVTSGVAAQICEACHQSGHDLFLSRWPRQ